MSEKKEVVKEKLEHSGVFNFSEFYAFAHSWLKDRKFGIMEDKYSEKLSGNARDIRVEWKISKDVSDYFKFEISMNMDARGLTDVEVEIDGERKKMNKGSVTVELKGVVVRDPQGKWEGSPMWRFMRDFYNKFIIPSRGRDMETMLMESIISLKDDLKSFLELTAKR